MEPIESAAARGLRAGRVSQPQPTAHLVPCAHSQCIVAAARAAMPSHLCRRYILSSPFKLGSSHAGRVASTIATDIVPMASTPLY